MLNIFLSVLSQLVSCTFFAQMQITLYSLTAYAVHSLLKYLFSHVLMHQSCNLWGGWPLKPFWLTLDNNMWVLNFKTLRFWMKILWSPYTHTCTHTHTNTHTQRWGHLFTVSVHLKWYLFFLKAVLSLCIMSSFFFCLWDFTFSNYLILLLILSFNHCYKLILFFFLAS